MDINYLYSVIELYIQKDDEKKASLNITKKNNKQIQFKLSKNASTDVTSIDIEISKLLENKNFENILKIYKGKYIIIDEKYEYNENKQTCYYYAKLNNGRTISFNGFSINDVNTIRNILYEIKYYKEEIRIVFDEDEKQEIGFFRLQETGFANYKVICIVAVLFLLILIVSLWFFTNL